MEISSPLNVTGHRVSVTEGKGLIAEWIFMLGAGRSIYRFCGIEEQGECLLIYVNMVKGKDEFIERT